MNYNAVAGWGGTPVKQGGIGEGMRQKESFAKIGEREEG